MEILGIKEITNLWIAVLYEGNYSSANTGTLYDNGIYKTILTVSQKEEASMSFRIPREMVDHHPYSAEEIADIIQILFVEGL